MDIKKLNPWNWFSREEPAEGSHPVATSQNAVALHPTDALAQFHKEFDHSFAKLFRSFGMGPLVAWPGAVAAGDWRPSIDVVSNDKDYIVSVEVPGSNANDVRLEVTPDGALIVSGEKRQETNSNNGGIHRIERSYGAFQRVLSLPEDVDRDAIDARFQDGVLTITCPKTAMATAPDRKIDIRKAA
ncbi:MULTISPECIES: Hsp20/alpha crystallin family protein [Asticcacaulis]|uniref:Hsp20/alpha crystallin family protein n=1 Tax=Asticcacaulis TaxID=76890 RepID=UPI001AE5F724|nr:MULTISPECIES: Hsp20/alpha crystallin family protein [Asticcacaulis]MBP2160417.1 HSP20 family protein [Asticcacaulis solisilvae]MDR6801462.1 HSP20 family protein [Asticcacaulis sp. BE141]